MRLSAFAPAKINLFLHVGALDTVADRHPVSSLMVFADLGDRLSIEDADHPEFSVDGPMAAALDGCDPSENLVVRARDLLLQTIRRPTPPFRLTLTKVLPVAAGLGGGSSDAGAALRLIRDALDLKIGDDELQGLAAALGADGPACFRAQPTVGEGWGEHLSTAPVLPRLDAVLVNPGAPCPTGAVYRAYDLEPGTKRVEAPPIPDMLESPEEVAAWLTYSRNDLETPAQRVCPEIAQVLTTLRDEPETLLARLSGSGATCFALCAGDFEAETLAERISAMRPGWWVKRCRLGGPWPD